MIEDLKDSGARDSSPPSGSTYTIKSSFNLNYPDSRVIILKNYFQGRNSEFKIFIIHTFINPDWILAICGCMLTVWLLLSRWLLTTPSIH